MLGTLRLVDPKATGAQTLRLVTALVVSIAVTGAVTGPLAYRAVEFRSALPGPLAAETAPAPSPDRGALNGAASRENSVADAASTSAAINPTLPVAADTPGPGSGAGSGTIVVQQAGAEPTVAGVGSAPDATSGESTTSVGENGVSPATASRPPAVAAVAGTEPATTITAPPGTPSPGTTVPAGATTTTRNPLDEFNPRPSCDDKAQELNAEDRLACASTPSGG